MFWVSELKIMNTRVLCPRHVSETRVRHALSVEIETETRVGDNCDCGLWMIVLRGSFTVWSRGCPWSRRLTLVQPSTYWRPLLAQRNQSVRPPTTCQTTLARPRPAERGPETLYLTSWPSRGQDLTRWSRLEGSLTSPSTPRGRQWQDVAISRPPVRSSTLQQPALPPQLLADKHPNTPARGSRVGSF